MKYSRFFSKAVFLLACVGMVAVSCEKAPELSVSAKNITVDAFTSETTVDISTGVSWTATVGADAASWLKVSPDHGKGNATITLNISENPAFVMRTGFVAIAGEGVRTDTVRVVQEHGVDVAEKIEDEAFRQFCITFFDNAPRDGKISLAEAATAFQIDAKGLNIESLAGIEYFTKLRNVNCTNNNIESADFSKNKELRTLDLSYNLLSQINVGENTKLTALALFNNELTGIDVSKNTALEWLAVSNNSLTALDVSNNPALDMLECNENKLTGIDVSKNTKLVTLYCGGNPLSSFDISRNTQLLNLWCNNIKVTNLDISHNTALQTLSCANNQFTSLNVSNNKELVQLYCDVNRLTSIDIGQNTKLKEFKCTSNQLTGEISIRNNTSLMIMDVQGNPLLKRILVRAGFVSNGNDNFRKDPTAEYIYP